MALLASVISIRIAVPAALVEIVVGALAGNIPGIREHVIQTHVITFLAGVGSLVLTFLAGAEIDPVSLRGHWKASVSIGAVSFALPFMAAFGFCGLVLGWSLHAAEIGGVCGDVWPDPRSDRQDAVHRAGDRRHPVGVRAPPDRPAALPARHRGHRGRGSAW